MLTGIFYKSVYPNQITIVMAFICSSIFLISTLPDKKASAQSPMLFFDISHLYFRPV